MKILLAALVLLSLTSAQARGTQTLRLSREVYRPVPFSSQYSDDGALIRNVYYPAVKALIPQLNSLYGVRLEDRKEAHITVVTPPEFKTSLAKFFTVSELLSRYRPSLQQLPFEAVCVGSRRSRDGKNLVFYLVVRSPWIDALRLDLAREAARRASSQGTPLTFRPTEFWPHVTIGFVKGDVFEFSKGEESCLPDTVLVVR